MSRSEPKYERAERRLRTLLGPGACPSPLLLGEWSMNLLAPDVAGMVSAHVSGCPLCQQELSDLKAYLEVTEADESPAEQRPSLLDEVKEIVLQWMLPSPMPMLAGVRGAMPRAQTFSAAHLWLAVTVQEAEDGRKNLLALVTREDGFPLDHGTAWLSQEHRLFMGGRVDPRGNLVVSGLEAGTYDLGIQCDGTRIWIRGVSV